MKCNVMNCLTAATAFLVSCKPVKDVLDVHDMKTKKSIIIIIHHHTERLWQNVKHCSKYLQEHGDSMNTS